jgi:hypothetical protein
MEALPQTEATSTTPGNGMETNGGVSSIAGNEDVAITL